MNLPEPATTVTRLSEAAATDGGDWRALSACRDADPELFFPLSAWGPSLTQLATAKEVCARCEVRAECLRFAMSTGQEYGVWGGTSEDERRAMRRAQHSLAQPPVKEQASRSKRTSRTQPVRLAITKASSAVTACPTVLPRRLPR